jgi:hypothetical protein
MDSREIITGDDDLHILIDTQSIDEALTEPNRSAEKILRYQLHDFFNFLRTPADSSHNLLADIEEYSIEEIPDQMGSILQWTDFRGSFLYTDEKLEIIQNRLSGADITLTKGELRTVAVRASLNRNELDGGRDVLLTNNTDVLESRRNLESIAVDRQGVRLNIMCPEEAAEFLGLFMRYRDEFRYFPNTGSDISYSEGFDLTSWCWDLSALLVPHSSNISGINPRLHGLILGLDELGYQYYMGTENHTNIRTRYHFDHCISLITGVFDSLAQHTRDKYDLTIRDIRTNIRTGYPLLKKLRESNSKLREYIIRNHRFVELIYVIRPLIVHKDGVMTQGPGFEHSGGGQGRPWKSHCIDLRGMGEKNRTEFLKYYTQLDDERLEYDPLTQWGIFCTSESVDELDEDALYIEPYQFVKNSVIMLLSYLDGFLEALGRENRHGSLAKEQPEYYSKLMNIQQYMMSPLL